MIITQTPLRISLFGGGTDLPTYYRTSPGSVLSTTIDKFIYVTVKQNFNKNIKVHANKCEEAGSVNEILHDIVRESMRIAGINKGIEVSILSDVPADGTGLGSSSAVTVGLLNALYAYKGVYLDSEELAQLACKIEIDILGAPIGKQDQYIAAYGGLKVLYFNQDETVRMEGCNLTNSLRNELNSNLLLFYSGLKRSASDILISQKLNTTFHMDILHQIKSQVKEASLLLEAQDLDAIGSLLDKGWQLKRQLAPGISNTFIDMLYNRSKEIGVTGGKINGAGGGGFLMLYCPHQYQHLLRQTLSDFQELKYKFVSFGTRIIFNHEE